MSDNHLEESSQDHVPENWYVLQALFLEQNGTPTENSSIGNPVTFHNWETLQILFQLNTPQSDISQASTERLSRQSDISQAPTERLSRQSDISQAPTERLSPQPDPDLPASATLLSRLRSQPDFPQPKSSNLPPIPTTPLFTLPSEGDTFQAKSSSNPAIPVTRLMTLSSRSVSSHAASDKTPPDSYPLLSEVNFLPPASVTAPQTAIHQSSDIPTAPEPKRSRLLLRRLGNVLNIFTKNKMQILLVASILFPYAVLIPYVISLTEHIKQQEQKETRTSNPCSSNVVIYLTPDNDSTHNDSSNVSSFKPLSLTLTQSRLHSTMELAVNSEATGSKKISLSLPQEATIIIQPTASQHKTRKNTAMH